MAAPGPTTFLLGYLCGTYRTAFAPANAVEEDLVFELALARWRQRRLWANENSVVTRTMQKMAPELAATDPGISQRTRIACAVEQLTAKGQGREFARRYDATMRHLYKSALANLIQVRRLRLPDSPIPEFTETNPNVSVESTNLTVLAPKEEPNWTQSEPE